MLLSVLSFIIFAVCLIVLLIKLPSVFTIAFIESIDKNASLFLTVLIMMKSVLHALMFELESRSILVVVLLTEFAMHIPFIVSSLTKSTDKLLFDIYFTKMLGVKHSTGSQSIYLSNCNYFSFIIKHQINVRIQVIVKHYICLLAFLHLYIALIDINYNSFLCQKQLEFKQ